MRLQIVTAPATEPVTLAEAKAQCRVSHSDEDDWFVLNIAAARIAAQDIQWRTYTNQTYALHFDRLPSLPISIPRAPLVSVDHVYIYDVDDAETEVDASVFYVDTLSQPGRLAFANGQSWPSINSRALNAVKIEFTGGYGANPEDTPQSVKDAILLYLCHAYENRAGEFVVPKQFRDTLAPDALYQ